MTDESEDINAVSIIDNLRAYFVDRANYVDGKHKTEIVAKQAMREGKLDIAEALLSIHGYLADMWKGDFETGLWNLATEIDFLKANNKGKYVGAAKLILTGFEDLIQFVNSHPNEDQKIAAAAELRKAKTEYFPEHMTMVERLNSWTKKNAGQEKTRS